MRSDIKEPYTSGVIGSAGGRANRMVESTSMSDHRANLHAMVHADSHRSLASLDAPVPHRSLTSLHAVPPVDWRVALYVVRFKEERALLELLDALHQSNVTRCRSLQISVRSSSSITSLFSK